VDGVFFSSVITIISYSILSYYITKGFPRSGYMFDVFVGTISKSTVLKLSPIMRDIEIARANRYTSLRQASEWGMRALQGTFPRLKSRLCSNAAKRRNIILACVLLNNFRTHFIGLNQITTVFSPYYEEYVNLSTYDRIKRYYYPENEQ